MKQENFEISSLLSKGHSGSHAEASSCDDSEAVVRSDRDVAPDRGRGEGEVSMKRCFEGRIGFGDGLDVADERMKPRFLAWAMDGW